MADNDKFQFGDLNPVAELANLAKHHIVTSVCVGGMQIFPTGPCDHCGSLNPSVQCMAGQQAIIGDPLITE
jgi:hypothetical protein